MQTYRSGQRYAVLIAALALVMLGDGRCFAGEPQPGPAPQAASKFAGSDTCAGCHEEIAKGIALTSHNRIKFQTAEFAGGTGCESCHGAGVAHVESGGDKAKITSFKNISTKEQNQRCLACHNYGTTHANFTRSVHATNNVGCLDCHSVHNSREKAKLLVKKGPELCFSCHTEQRAEFSQPFRHRVRQGLLTCQDCHNEHGGYAAKQLRTTVGQDEVCFRCHTEKRGPFVYEHLPVKAEGCSSCHTPHGSTNPRLLKVSQINILCLQCHTATHNVASAAPIGPAKNQNGKWQACTMCHSAIHGSNTGAYLNK